MFTFVSSNLFFLYLRLKLTGSFTTACISNVCIFYTIALYPCSVSILFIHLIFSLKFHTLKGAR